MKMHKPVYCAWCLRRAEPVKGVILERLYPGRTTCVGCGRLQVDCSCEREGLAKAA
jgi:hypothetical protein